MSVELAGLFADLQDALAVAFAVFLRVGAAMAVLPAFGERTVPVRVRLALTLALTALVAPALADGVPALPQTPTGWVGFGAAEVIAGLALGLGFRLFVVALQMAGTIAANVTSLAQVFGGAAVDPQPAVAHLMVVGGLALAAMAGLHVKLVVAFVASYGVMPPGRPLAAGMLADWGVGGIARSFALAFSLAAPFLIAGTVYNLALGAINRAMPQLMVAFVGAPALAWGGIALLLVALPHLLPIWLDAFDGALRDPMALP